MKNKSGAIVAVAAVVIVLLLLAVNGKYLDFTPEEIRDRIMAFGWVSPMVFVLALLFRPFTLFPTSVLFFTGGLAFGWVWGSLLSWAGAALGSLISYAAARQYGERFIFWRKSPKWERVRKNLEEKGFYYVFILRLFPLMNFDLVSYLSGLSKIRFFSYYLATLAGVLPSIAAYSFLGASTVEGGKVKVVITAGLLLLSAVATFAVRNKIR